MSAHSHSRRKALAVLALAGVAGVAELAPLYGEEPIPSSFVPLHRDLAARLERLNGHILGASHGVRGAQAPTPDFKNPSPPNTKWRAEQRLYFDRLRQMGAQVLVMEVPYPMASASFALDAGWREFFTESVSAARARGMRMAVVHSSLPKAEICAPARAIVGRLSFAAWSQARHDEAVWLTERLSPDYLSLLATPEASDGVLDAQTPVAIWTRYADDLVESMKRMRIGNRPKLGLRLATSQSPEFLSAFSAIDGLDYLDLKLYETSDGRSDYLQRALSWSRHVRSANPKLRLASTSAWIAKPALGAQPSEGYAFWDDLDARFVHTLSRLAASERYLFFAPRHTRHLFGYAPYTPGQSAAGLEERINQTALLGLYKGRVTRTGRAYEELRSS